MGRPWNSYLRWGRQQCGRLCGVDLADNAQMQGLADDRETWKSHTANIVQHYERCIPQIYHTNWPSSRKAFQTQIQWLFTAWLTRRAGEDGGGFRVCWIDRTEGLQQYPIDSRTLQEGLLNLWKHQQIVRNTLVWQVLISSEVLEENLPDILNFITQMTKSFQVVFAEVYPETWETHLKHMFPDS